MDLRSLTPDELKKLMAELGEKPFRAGQIFSWLHEKRAGSYDEMSDISKILRERLKREYPLKTLNEEECLVSKDGTRKYLFSLHDGNVIESVLMHYSYGNSVCISSEVGCAMGCRFCASTIGGKVRPLEACEMLLEVYAIQNAIDERISNIVVMGIGEPLDNYDELVRFIRLVSDEKGLNLSRRSITVSTCGIVPKIYNLADEDLSVTLAISLHAPNDEKRKELMPIANRYSIDELMAAAKYYFEKTGRRVSFEYALAEGRNDGDEDAAQLAKLLKGFPCHVNLIPVNPVTESGIRGTQTSHVQLFYKKLEKYGINVTIRREIGTDINGACGQLRKSHLETME